MCKKLAIAIIFIFNVSVVISQQPFSWFADPYTVGFNYTDVEAVEQQASSWQPGLFQFFTDENYNSGSFLTSTAFNIDNWTDVEGTTVLKNRLLLGFDKINLSDENGLRALIDKNGYNLVNGASYQTIKIYNNNNVNGQIDLHSGHNNNWIARLGATNPGSDRGSMTLYDTNGFEKVDISVDENNKGKLEADYAELVKITVESDGADFSGIFEGGKGVRIQSISDNTADLTLQANDVGNITGMIQSDPNFNKSSLRLKSNSSVQIDLDADLNGSGPNSFVVNNGIEELFNLSKQNGAVIKKMSPSITNPHLSILDNSSNGFGRINLGNYSGFKWQIAGRPNDNPALSFHLTDINGANGGSDKMILYGSGDLAILGTLTENSDLTLKTNIKPISGALNNLLAIKGYNYNWKDSKRSERLQTGVIAQEVAQVFPELVHADKEGILSVSYSGLIPYLIESIKELKKEIDTLKSKE